MSYVDGYLLPVPKDRTADYIRMAGEMATIFRDYGALSVTETMAEDAPVGELTSFPRAVMMGEDETVFLSWITYRDRAHRDEVHGKVFADPRMEAMMDIPVDGKRMIFGGFRVVVDM